MLLVSWTFCEEEHHITGITMRAAIVVSIIIALQYYSITLGQLPEWSVRCSAPAAELTKEATVTCLFPHDISQKKTDFFVRHYESELQRGQNGTHQMNKLADCMWMHVTLDCSMKPGYKQEEQDVTSTNFTLRIPHFLPNHTGQYSCHVDGHEFEICSLLPLKALLTPGKIATTAAESIHFKQNNLLISETTTRAAEGEQSVTSLLIIIVSAIGATITLASVVVTAYIVYKYYLLKKSVRRTDTIQMVETGARDSRHDFEDVFQIEQTPIPDTNDWQHPDVTTNDDYFVVLGQNNVEEDSQERIISTNNPTAVRDKEAFEDYNTKKLHHSSQSVRCDPRCT